MSFRRVAVIAASLACACMHAQRTERDVLRAALADSAASAVVVDVDSGKTVAEFGTEARRRHAPGSVLKPFVLLATLERGIVAAGAVLPCRGTLTVGTRNLACTHPRELREFTAESALAYSCNAYFAAVARRMDAATLDEALSGFGLHADARAEAPEARELLALGLVGVTVSPAELAAAYRTLALKMHAPDAAMKVVRAGLEDSVRYGMAHAAATDGVRLAGKTGTASERGQPWTGGWFAGIVMEEDAPRRVLVVYVPRGSGADAALLAHRVLLREKRR